MFRIELPTEDIFHVGLGFPAEDPIEDLLCLG